jgi:Fe-S-cluster containining protein
MTLEAPRQPQPAHVTASFSLRIGADTLNASAELPAARTTLTEILPIIQHLEDAIVENSASDAAAAGKPVSCRAGCGACCRQMVPLSLFEAQALTHWLQTFPKDRIETLRARFDHSLSELRKAGVLDGILDGSRLQDEGSRKQLGIDYFHAGVPCPFLENENCSIYENRPLICREYLVTSPPAFCTEPTVNDVAQVELPVRLSRTLVSLGKETSQQTRGWIPLVFLLAWAEKADSPGDLVSGTGPDVLKRFLDRMIATPADDTSSPAL